jgi:hypothetical protein
LFTNGKKGDETMFEFAVLRRTGNNEDVIDVGLLAETLLFYERVHLLLDGGSLTYLLKTIGPDFLLNVLDRNGVSASFIRENLGTLTNTNNGLQSHSFAQFTVDPPTAKGRQHRRVSNEEWVSVTVDRAIGKGIGTKKFTKKLLTKLSSADWKLPAVGSQDLPSVMRDEMKDVLAIKLAVKRVVNTFLPSFKIPYGWYFRPVDVGGQFAIDTNFDFTELNQEYHKSIPPSHSSLTPAYLLTQLLDARSALVMGFKYLGELVVDPVTTAIIRLKALELIRKRDAHVDELDLFQDMHLTNGKKIRECLNSGERDFAEFIELLDDATLFKQWLGSRNPDESLLTEYFRAVTADSWIDKLGTKTSRWTITTGLGFAVEALYPTGVATAAALGVSLLDATLLDRVLKGWRPNHFVAGSLADFIGGKNL